MRSSVPGPGSISATRTAAAPSSPELSKTISSSTPSDIAWRSNTRLTAQASSGCRRNRNRRSFGTTSSLRTTGGRPAGTGRTCWSEAFPTPAPARTTFIRSMAIYFCITRVRRSSRARAASVFMTIFSSAGKPPALSFAITICRSSWRTSSIIRSTHRKSASSSAARRATAMRSSAIWSLPRRR
jgi:hypothetical protein